MIKRLLYLQKKSAICTCTKIKPMKNLLRISLIGFLLISCDSITGFDFENLSKIIENTSIEADSTAAIKVISVRSFRVQRTRKMDASNAPYYIINDIIVPPFNDNHSALEFLDPGKITGITILKDEEAAIWFKEQDLIPTTEAFGIIFVETTQENWDEGFEFQRVKGDITPRQN